ncbi:O-methyltransferase [Mycena alexandri]|uniref:O-methyltransferase n=1 Tax=Mycena alexandri TaxID=1745969 RepID=A0AAD6TCP1_9AGAR|nr:O-methyltransferase [Mycena alexandri]
MASTLIQLSDLISSSVATIDGRCKALSRTYPDLDNPDNKPEDESVVNDSEIVEAISIALAAASQLIANIRMPTRTILDTSLAHLLSAALGVVTASATAEIIREAGPQGCHVEDIASRNGMDPMKIARVLRPLATQHIFREVSPDVFAHNRISALIDTGKSSQEVLAAPEDKFHGAAGYGALIGLNTDETFKAAAYIEDVVVATQKGQEADEFNTPLNRAFGTHVDLFSWYERPENRIRFRRFGMAMDASRRVSPQGWLMRGFIWSLLADGALIVDVGGGIGSVSLDIANANPHLRFVIQDKAAVTQEGKVHWDTKWPGAFAEGRVAFHAHDFFGSQPVKDASVFLLRGICHNWTDSYVLTILKHLREAAQSTTKLVVIERIVPFVCGEDIKYEHIPGAVASATSPRPLLANRGVMGPYLADLQIMALCSGCERTLPHYVKLFSEAGWEIEEVFRVVNSLDHIVARPV